MEQEDHVRGGQVDNYDDLSADEQEHDDALFKSLNCDKLQDEHEARTDFAMTLDLVERLSWDATSQGSADEDEGFMELMLPTLLSAEDDTASDNSSLHRHLVSPCSVASSPPRLVTPMIVSPLTRVSISSPVEQLRFFESEDEAAFKQAKGSNTQQLVDEEDEEHKREKVIPCNPEACCSPDTFSILTSSVTTAPDHSDVRYRSAESTATTDDGMSDNESDQDIEQSRVSTLRPSLLPQVPSIARWTRQKARTHSGIRLTGVAHSLSLAASKTRTHSLSHVQTQRVDDEDDGDFSSDDEGYTPELHRHRASETAPFHASRWRRARHASLDFAGHGLSANVRTGSAIMTKRLQVAKDKLNNGLHLLRSSVSSVTNEESCMDSPACHELTSAPTGLCQDLSGFADTATSMSVTSWASTCTIDSETPHPPTRQQQLRAGVCKAAGLLNAATAEAARQFKSRGFCAPHLPSQKAASETEEEDSELFAACPLASDQRHTR